MSDSLPSRQRLPHLDGLRGIAALSVVLYHVHNLFGLTLGFERCYLFVDVFFMLSGFVLTRAWADDFAQGVSDLTLLRARIRRLWPTIAIGSSLGAAVHLVLNDVQNVFPLLLLALLLIPYIGQSGPIYPLNGPQWSILWELIANLVHVRYLRTIRTLQLLALCLAMAMFTFAAVLLCGTNTSGPNGDLWWLAAARVGWSYTMGIFIAYLHRVFERPPLLSWWQALSLFVTSVLVLPTLRLSDAAGDTAFTVVLSPVLFWLVVTARRPVAASGWLMRLGALSFPLYAIHLPLLAACVALVKPKGTAAAVGVSLSLFLAACLSRSNDRGYAKRRTDAPLGVPI